MNIDIRQNLPLLTVLTSGMVAVFLLFVNPSGVASDDSLFYLQIAYPGFEPNYPSFNGMDKTNGFHPLNQFCATLLASTGRWLQGDAFSKSELMRMMILFDGLFVSFTLLLLRSYFLFRKIGSSTVFLLLALEGVYLYGGMYFSEAHLNAFFLTLFLLRLARVPEISESGIILGVLGGLCILSRLDNALLMAGTTLWLLYSGRAELKFFLLSMFIVTLPYFIWNYFTFGHFLPVSGFVKSTFPHVRPVAQAWAQLTVLGKLVGISLFVCVPLSFGVQIGKIETRVFLVSALATWIYYFCFQEASYHSWYYVLASLALLSFGASLSSKLEASYPALGRSMKLAKCGSAVLCMLCIPLYAALKAQLVQKNFNLNEALQADNFHPSSLIPHPSSLIPHPSSLAEAGVKLAKVTSVDSNILTIDLPGYLAYFSNRRISALDCLTLNYKSCFLMKKDLKKFIRERRITYLVWSFNECRSPITVHDYFKKSLLGEVEVDCSQAVLLSVHPLLLVVPIRS